MATLKQLQSKLSTLTTKIKKRQGELAGLKEQAKGLKTKVADAKAAKAKKPKG